MSRDLFLIKKLLKSEICDTHKQCTGKCLIQGKLLGTPGVS